ncbi:MULTISPECIES: RluA family pseudouridine synthase [unclassified Bacillus (in: firmicutes)]|uniref:RluA family pseudouridine synthase n=1 Tax=unclassified Bacillus (in: firmicutes) TaxID=185979 RepID=UPI0008EDC7CB|nr:MULTISPECIES: RluA family pseudouridine synthase [unclassified Bacillus (in: firmicutes)]SFA80948.1 23S rRNA pseudouridine1911/1915/1917 synthase [Bacillus sp. UNCCL13]SFQ71096.1 23S rRNA pseudouridine1911/1915/1917 synthase [Bacillus sp. cl95]
MLRTRRTGEWFEITVPNYWEGITIEELFRQRWDSPKKLTHALRMNAAVKLNGTKANWLNPLQKNDKLQLHIFQDVEIHLTATYLELDIIYEDDHLIVLNKMPFMNTHPNSFEDKETLSNGVAYYLQSKGEIRNFRHVHRLDRETSGAILFSKHELAGAILDRKLELREIKRTYLALVQGTPKKKRGTINEPIGKDRHHATRRRVSPSGQSATTHYEVIKEFKNEGLTLVKCWLDTGRTHQIRVHLSHIGHPIIGDTLYGGNGTQPRVMLHAAKLEFIHPLTLEEMVVYAPFPTDFPESYRINLSLI